MNHDELKVIANNYLKERAIESDFIEYKKSHLQKDSILKTLCAYANNLMNRSLCLLLIDVEECDDLENKARPKLPISGLSSSVEVVENAIKSLVSYIRPKICFDITSNIYNDKPYVIVAFSSNPQGPFEVTEKAENDKDIKLKRGRYVRVERETRIATFKEEFELLKKFANYHFTEKYSKNASIDDLDIDYLREYLHQTPSRDNTYFLDKEQIVKNMKLVDGNMRVKNYALLMFSRNPEQFIPYSYVELIYKSQFGESVMSSKDFKGPIWKQVKNVMNEIDNNYIKSFTLRSENKLESRRIYNFPYSACEELITNAIVHKDYENPRTVQIYVYEDSIVINNYNKPIPPVTINALNTQTSFPDREYENPSIREMFKDLDLIESFGSGVGKAKRAMSSNDDVAINYKEYDENIDITSVTIPISPLYKRLAFSSSNLNIGAEKLNISGENFNIGAEKLNIEEIINNSSYSINVRESLLLLFKKYRNVLFSRKDIISVLGVSNTTGTNYLSYLANLNLIEKERGQGKGKYRFR